MAHHHHHQNHTHHQQPPPTTTCYCTPSYSSCYCTQSHHPYPPPPPLPASDSLLQAIASQLLQSNPPDPYSHQNPHKPHKSQPPKQRRFHHQGQQEPLHSLESLLSRIEALEVSLNHYSSSHCPRSSSFSSSNSSSLRDCAARIIQTHFRAFLVRRSRTLRQLKDLAFIKSAFASLKSSVSGETHFDFHAVSQKGLALLIRLDSVQCGDPIVRDGKRSISRDLVRFLEFIDGVGVKRQGMCLKTVKNMRSGQNVNKSRVLGTKGGGLGRDQREMIGKLRDRIERIRAFARVSENDEEDVELEGFEHVSDDDEEEERFGQCRGGALLKRHGFQAKAKKSVSFAENGNVFRVFSDGSEQVSSGDGSDSSDDHGERVENGSEVEDVKGFAQETEDDDEVQMENGGSPQTSSDGERNPGARATQRRGDVSEGKSHYKGQSDYLLFSAPLPVKMDSKEDLVKRNKGVKIVT